MSGGALMVRRYVGARCEALANGLPAVTARTLSCLQFNTLTDWGSDSFEGVPKEQVTFAFRSPMILEEITRSQADIVCLEEVDHFTDFFEPHLKELGYAGVFQSKREGKDGCAMFVRESRLRFGTVNAFNYTHAPLQDKGVFTQGAIVAQLHWAHDNQPAVVAACTHLKAKPPHEATRVLQVRQLVEVAASMNTHGGPVLVMGDFNTECTGPVYEFMTRGTTTTTLPTLNVEGALVDETSTCTGAMALASAYGDYSNPGEPHFTTAKRRDKVVARTIDYIFYSAERLRVEALLELPTLASIEPQLFPSAQYPSDHLAIGAVFSLI